MKSRKIIITVIADEVSGLNRVSISGEDKFQTTEIIGILEWAKVNFIREMAELGNKKLSEAHFANIAVQDAIKEAEKD